MIYENKTIKKDSKLLDYLFYFSVIDILFLPVYNKISIPYSIFFIWCWFIMNLKKLFLNKKEIGLFFVFIFMALGSTFLSLMLHDRIINGFPVWEMNIKVLGFQITILVYYFFFKTYFELRRYTSLKKVLLAFVIYGLILAVIYNFNKSLYAEIRTFYNADYESMKIYFDNLLMFRYKFIWTEPNNVIYGFVSVATFLIYNEKHTLKEIIIILVTTIIIEFSTMSSGGLVSIACVLCVSLCYSLYSKKKIRIVTKFNYISTIFGLLSVVVIFVVFIKKGNFLINTDVLQTFLARTSENSSDSRIDIWKNILENKNIFFSLVFGDGTTLLINNIVYRHHSGHLFLIYGYGFIAYLVYMFFIFRKRKNIPWKYHFFLIPIFIGFTINTILEEQKLMLIVVLLVANLSVKRSENYYEKN